jgi:hypothetical protein
MSKPSLPSARPETGKVDQSSIHQQHRAIAKQEAIRALETAIRQARNKPKPFDDPNHEKKWLADSVIQIAILLAKAGLDYRLEEFPPAGDGAKAEAIALLLKAKDGADQDAIVAQLEQTEKFGPSFFRDVKNWLQFGLVTDIANLPAFQRPQGWEGPYPEPVETLQQLIGWLEKQIRCKDHLLPKTELGKTLQQEISDGHTLRNAYRVIHKLGLLPDMPREPDEKLTPVQEVRFLRKLLGRCHHLARNSDSAKDRRQTERKACRDGRKKEQSEGAAEKQENCRWLTVSDASRASDIGKGTISRAADQGKLKSNGKKGRERRIDSVDLNRWKLKRIEKSEPGESYSKVEKLTKNNVSDYRGR